MLRLVRNTTVSLSMLCGDAKVLVQSGTSRTRLGGRGGLVARKLMAICLGN